MKRINYPLLIGFIIILSILIMAFFAEDISNKNPYSLNLGHTVYEDGYPTYSNPPFPPSDLYPFGTDILGRDIFTRILYGAKVTLQLALTATIFRFILSIPIAFFAGFGNKQSSSLIKYFSNTFSAIPALIISIFILNLGFIKNLDLNHAIIAFAIVFTFVEWGRLGKILEDNVKSILNMNFIQGDIAIGKNKFQIAIQNVLPHLIPTIVVYFFIEMSRSLLLIAQLGIFGVYVGKNKIGTGPFSVVSELGLAIVPEYYPEWGGMLSTGRYAMLVRKPWIILYPTLAITVTLVGFNMLGEGIKMEINKRKSMVLTYIKRTAFHLSPKNYIFELRNFKKYKTSCSIKTSVIAIILIISFLPAPASIIAMDSQEIFNHVLALSDDKYEGRLVGSEGRDLTAEYIIDNLKKSNVQPLFDDEYTHNFEFIKSFADIESSKMYVQNASGSTVKTFEYRNDYVMNMTFDKEKLSGKILTLSEYENKEFNEDDTCFVIYDKDITNLRDATVSKELGNISKRNNVTAVIYPLDNLNGYNKYLSNLQSYDWFLRNKTNPYFRLSYTIYVDSDTIESLLKLSGDDLVIDTKIRNDLEQVVKRRTSIIPYESKEGINIGGIIPGKSDESIVIATTYDYLGYEDNFNYKGLLYNASSMASVLEIAEKLSNYKDQPEKNIVFLFFDSSKYDLLGVEKFAIFKKDIINDKSFIITMDYLGYYNSDSLYLDASRIPSDHENDFEVVKYLTTRADQLDINISRDMFIDQNNISFDLYGKTGNPSVISLRSVGKNQLSQYYNNPQDDIGLIDKDKLKNQSQLIIDAILRFAY